MMKIFQKRQHIMNDDKKKYIEMYKKQYEFLKTQMKMIEKLIKNINEVKTNGN